MEFKELLLWAKAGNEMATVSLLEMYRPLLVRSAIINGVFDDDLYQELCITLLRCIQMFQV